MVTVFLAFVLGDMVPGKMFGLGFATAIFIDATLVRMVLVPATMALLGDRNWWLPRWLDRILPRLTVESAGNDSQPEEETSEPAHAAAVAARPSDEHELAPRR